MNFKRFLVCMLIIFSGALNAHDLWVRATSSKANSPMSIHFAYGHNFPNPNTEKIPPDRASVIFSDAPVKVHSAKGDIDVQKKAGGQHYDYVTKTKVGNGTYIITGEYNPTFWSTDTTGHWYMAKSKHDIASPASCQLVNKESKSVVSLGKADINFATKPIGQRLEIVPLKDPNALKGGEALPVQVLFYGKPLANVEVGATFEGFGGNKNANTHDEHPFSFKQKTDHDGKVDIYTYPKKGNYIALVEFKSLYPDTSKCDTETFESSFTFKVSK